MQYVYKALKNSVIVSKKIEADSEKIVIDYLRGNGYFPISIKSVQNSESGILSSLFDRVSFNDIVDFTRQLAIMLNAGLTIIDSLDILKKQIEKISLRKIIQDIDTEIRSGNPLSTALKKYPQHFSNLYISLVKSGEASGKLGDILIKLSDNLEKQREFNGKMKGALIYPVIVVVAMIGVMFVMITFVVPKLLNLYKDFDMDLPFTTKILMAVSSFCVNFWPIIIAGVVGAVIAGKAYLKSKNGKLFYDTMMLKIPIINNVIKMSALVDTTRTLSILIGSGVSILEGLEIIVETADNEVFHQSFINVRKKVEKGQSLGNTFEQEGIFPPILVQMVMVGEQTGHLDDTLGRLSRYFEMESELAVKAMTTMIEPAILVFLGLGVGFLVMSVITPIYNLTSSFK
ncbi:MAG: type II secretion system F family protein [bacterium]|nr:type II secretion system F family protein [bacterium]